jgi:hypothetical protein
MSTQGISTQGIVLIDLMGLVFIALIVNLVRTHRLHVGYGVIWLLAVLAPMIIISLRPLLMLVTQAVGAIYPASALSLLAFVFIFLMLIFFSVQLSIIADRQVEIAQSQALQELRDQESPEPGKITGEDLESQADVHDTCS